MSDCSPKSPSIAPGKGALLGIFSAVVFSCARGPSSTTRPVLEIWRADGLIAAGLVDAEPDSLGDSWRQALAQACRIGVEREPVVVARLASSGKARQDEALRQTRAAFADADLARLCALSWTLYGEDAHRRAALDRLRAWSREWQPTGHPIDETRLESLLHTFLLLQPSLPPSDAKKMRGWLLSWRQAMEAWSFGPKTGSNNHRTHQLKMLLLLDRALADPGSERRRQAEIRRHLEVNLDAASGKSVDLIERGALYYHCYDLEAWLEIAWLQGELPLEVHSAVELLLRRLEAGELGGEFSASEAELDARRAAAGFGYGAAGSTFDPAQARRVLDTYTVLAGAWEEERILRASPGLPQRQDLYHGLRRALCE